jgi:hypothetical protein
MEVRATYGDNSYVTEPLTFFSATWPELCDLWLSFAKIERPGSDDHKKSPTPFIAPFLLEDDAVGKTIVNIAVFGAFFVIDIDTGGWTLETLQKVFAPFPHCIHTTTHSVSDDEHLRVAWRLSREPTLAEHKSIWLYANDLVGNAVDPKTYNPNPARRCSNGRRRSP